MCEVLGRITPEHRVRTKPYTVTAKIDESEESFISVVCDDCPASEGMHQINKLFFKNNLNLSLLQVDVSMSSPLCFGKPTLRRAITNSD
jgi:hypothetical protein